MQVFAGLKEEYKKMTVTCTSTCKKFNLAGLWLDAGTMFGKAGAGFQRINVACPRATLRAALKRLADAAGN